MFAVVVAHKVLMVVLNVLRVERFLVAAVTFFWLVHLVECGFWVHHYWVDMVNVVLVLVVLVLVVRS